MLLLNTSTCSATCHQAELSQTSQPQLICHREACPTLHRSFSQHFDNGHTQKKSKRVYTENSLFHAIRISLSMISYLFVVAASNTEEKTTQLGLSKQTILMDSMMSCHERFGQTLPHSASYLKLAVSDEAHKLLIGESVEGIAVGSFWEVLKRYGLARVSEARQVQSVREAKQLEAVHRRELCLD